MFWQDNIYKNLSEKEKQKIKAWVKKTKIEGFYNRFQTEFLGKPPDMEYDEANQPIKCDCGETIFVSIYLYKLWQAKGIEFKCPSCSKLITA